MCFGILAVFSTFILKFSEICTQVDGADGGPRNTASASEKSPASPPRITQKDAEDDEKSRRAAVKKAERSCVR